jgi:hypothetical protein
LRDRHHARLDQVQAVEEARDLAVVSMALGLPREPVDRVVVDVDHAGARRDGLRDLVGVVRGRDAGADVEELPDPGLAARNRTILARNARLARTDMTIPG